jgi:gluconolactonase
MKEGSVSVDVRSEGLRRLVDENVEVEQLGTGFTFTEGPIWNPDGEFLLFSDMPGDTRRRWDEANGVQVVMSPSNKGNGMTLDATGRLLVCEHSTSSLVRMDPGGTNSGREVLATHYEGKELNSPNDVCVKSDGSIWFSDPWYGRMPVFGVERERELGWQGVFRIAPGGGEPQLVVDKNEYEQPNGLCFSPDESLLYINDTPGALIKVYDVGSDGSLSHGRMFFEGIGTGEIEKGIPDGMKCDEQGNIWVTGPGGVWVISPEGEHLGTVNIPENTGNLAWGGPDWHTLFIPSSTSLYAVKTKVGPRREPYMHR